MNDGLVLENIIYCGAVASGVFFLLILLISRTGVFEEVRDEAGHFRKDISLKGKLGFAVFFSIILGMLWWSNYLLAETVVNPGFLTLWLNAFGTFFIVHLFDLIVLDWLIVVWWHPKFLNMPDTDYYTKFKPHWDGFLRGIPFGIVISGLVSMIFLLLYL